MASREDFRTIRLHSFEDEEEEFQLDHHSMYGPSVSVHVSRYGIVTYECEGKKLVIASIDPGPGGIQVFVEGPHEDGSP